MEIVVFSERQSVSFPLNDVLAPARTRPLYVSKRNIILQWIFSVENNPLIWIIHTIWGNLNIDVICTNGQKCVFAQMYTLSAYTEVKKFGWVCFAP